MSMVEPGTGTQYYVEACMNPEDHPRLKEEIHAKTEGHYSYEKACLEASQYHLNGRLWQTGGEYWDTELSDLVVLEAVVRRSSWCSNRPAEESPVRLRFSREGGNSYEVDPNHPRGWASGPEITDRFLPRCNVPFELK